MLTTDPKIWRYVTLPKLISLLSTEAIYFACPSQFHDPYEGFYPESHMKAFEPVLQKAINDSRADRDHLAAMFPHADLSRVDNSIATMILKMQEAVQKARLKFGVSCWHKNECESEAMWRLYSSPSDPAIAIESTVEQLQAALGGSKKVVIDEVRYVDFDNEVVEKGRKHYGLFLKRKSFMYEQELRATILLEEEGKGELIKCDICILINKIHISPFAPKYFGEAVRYICAANAKLNAKPICQSTLFSKPPPMMNLK